MRKYCKNFPSSTRSTRSSIFNSLRTLLQADYEDGSKNLSVKHESFLTNVYLLNSVIVVRRYEHFALFALRFLKLKVDFEALNRLKGTFYFFYHFINNEYAKRSKSK